jgi:transcription termination factor Rho
MANETRPRREPSSSSRLRKSTAPDSTPSLGDDAELNPPATSPEATPVSDEHSSAPSDDRELTERDPYREDRPVEREPIRYREPARPEREPGPLARDRDRDREHGPLARDREPGS